MAAITSVEALEAAIVERIEALDASAYTQGSLTATWKESAQALDPDSAPNPTAHLCFAAWAESVPTTEYSSDCLRAEAEIVVRFLFRLRSGAQPTDMREVSSAAQQIVTSLRAGFEAVPMSVANAGIKTPLAGGWMSVDVAFIGRIKLVAV